MPHNDDHGHSCGEHAHDGDHSHDHTNNGGPSDNLFMHIDRDNVVALNSVSGGSLVIKPWDERMDERVVSLSPGARNAYVTLSPERAVHRVGRRRSAVGTMSPLAALLFFYSVTMCLLMNGRAKQHHPCPLHRICETTLAPAQIRSKRSDARQSGTRKCAFFVRNKSALTVSGTAVCECGQLGL